MCIVLVDGKLLELILCEFDLLLFFVCYLD